MNNLQRNSLGERNVEQVMYIAKLFYSFLLKNRADFEEGQTLTTSVGKLASYSEIKLEMFVPFSQ